MSNKRTTTAKRIIDMFIAEYEDRHNRKYLVNFPMVKSVEKVAQFYTTAQVSQAMLYYFETHSDHSIWEFINEIDKNLNGSVENALARERIKNLIEDTKRRLGEYRGGSDNEGTGDEGYNESPELESIEVSEEL